MFDLEKPTTSKAAKQLSYSNNSDDLLDDDVHEQDESVLWSIDDDTMFFARGLKNHSAGKGKSVFVAWNENYLLNFVFKTSSKTKKTSLTKVRLTMPLDETGEPEEVLDLLILELNTLLLMRSGRVYYFRSVKSIHSVVWLDAVRCISDCPCTQFSVIRCRDSCDKEQTPKQLLLEVYQDSAQLGKFSKRNEALLRCYDISFDVKNLFNCDWSDERYTLLSLVANEVNVDFLRKLMTTANFLSFPQERIVIELNQEVHIFTVSGNLFMLVGSLVCDSILNDPDVENYSILLLNSYVANIECVQMDVSKSLLMVLLQSGHLDIWYRSPRMLGSIQHFNHELSYFMHYDYDPCNNSFYITTPEEVSQIQVIYSDESNLCECRILENRKAICGIIASTWVESLQQLVCLSYNNIFYRLCFLQEPSEEENTKEVDIKYENYNMLYALTTNTIKELMSKAQIVNELKEQPVQLHNAIELEFQKQQLLALGYKRKLWQKIFNSHIEYHKTMPSHLYFCKGILVIKASFDCQVPEQEENSMYALIFMTLSKHDTAFISIVQKTTWFTDIFCRNCGKSLLLYMPPEILHQRMCIAIRYATSKNCRLLPDFTLNLRTFIHHCSQYVCLNINVDIENNEKTFYHTFSHGVQQWALTHDHLLDTDYLIKLFKQEKLNAFKPTSSAKTLAKQELKIRKLDVFKLVEVFDIKYETILKSEEVVLFFLQLFPLHLSYDEKSELLSISTEHVESLLYFKLYMMYQIRSSLKKDVIDIKESTSLHLKIMHFQSDIERIYGTLLSSPECMDIDSGSTSLHLENLHKVYLKLRSEFNDIFR